MSKLTVIGNAAVVTSTVAKSTITKLSKFKPESTKLKDENGKTLFAVGSGPKGTISQYGIVFDSENLEGKATVTIALPTDLSQTEKKDWVKENFGYAILNLNSLEAQMNTEFVITQAEFEAMSNSIVVE